MKLWRWLFFRNYDRGLAEAQEMVRLCEELEQHMAEYEAWWIKR